MIKIKTNLELVTIASEINLEGDYLIGRPDGKKFANHLENRLMNISRNHIVIINFDGVELMDGSFSDEVFGKLARARGRNELDIAPYVLHSVNSVSLDNLEQALLSRPVRELGLRNCLVPVLGDKDNKLSLLGKYEDHVRQTFELLNIHEQLTTKLVSEKLKLNTAASSTRLKALFDLGLAIRTEARDEQGKQFFYFSLS